MIDFAIIILGYLLGSIPFGMWIPKCYGVADIRRHGSGNVGSTNVIRSVGVLPGLLVMVGDIGKGVLAVLAVSLIDPNIFSIEVLRLLAGLAAVVGHIVPVFLKFKGGKGVNTALGVMIILLPMAALGGLAVFIITVSVTKFVSLGSMIASVVFFAIVLAGYLTGFMYVPNAYLAVATVIPILIIFAHRSNIKRLKEGRESRFSLHSSQKEVNSNV